MSGARYSGNMSFGQLDANNNVLYWEDLDNVVKFGIAENSDILERISKGRGTRGNTLDTLGDKQPTEVSIITDDMSDALLTINILGVQEEINVPGGAVTDEEIISVWDKSVPLAAENVTGVIVGDDAIPTTTYVLDTDYTLDARNGSIKALSTGAITDGQTLFVDYTGGPITGTKIRGGLIEKIGVAILFDGINDVDGTPIKIKAPRVDLAPSGETDFMADEFLQLELSGTFILLPGNDEAYTIETNIVEA